MISLGKALLGCIVDNTITNRQLFVLLSFGGLMEVGTIYLCPSVRHDLPLQSATWLYTNGHYFCFNHWEMGMS